MRLVLWAVNASKGRYEAGMASAPGEKHAWHARSPPKTP